MRWTPEDFVLAPYVRGPGPSLEITTTQRTPEDFVLAPYVRGQRVGALWRLPLQVWRAAIRACLSMGFGR
jgi:hypothetical protein